MEITLVGRQVTAPDQTFHFTSGRLCLDFANIISWRRAAQPTERLRTYRDLVSWVRQVGLVWDLEADRLVREAEDRPREAGRFLRSALQLRELIFRLFASLSEEENPSPADLASLNDWLARALPRARIQAVPGGFEWSWTPASHPLARVLWSIARSAADLLTSPDMMRVRQCAGKECRWLFMDTTRNHSRRWCTMAVCGNRAKAERHYHRSRVL